MDELKISIIVPIYNKEKFLNRCIESVLLQSYKNWELILINDGSTDSSSQICMEYSNVDKRIAYYEQENRGVSAARNTGIEKASGIYICYIDPDDYISENLFEKCFPFMQNEVDCIVYGINKVEKNKNKLYYVDKDIIVEGKDNIGSALAYIKHQHLFTPVWNKMYRKEFIDTYKIRYVENLELFEDLIFNQEFFHHVHNFACISFIGYNYSIFSNKDCLSHKRLSPKEMIEVAKRFSKNDFRCSVNYELNYHDNSFFMNFLRKIIKISIMQDDNHKETIQYIKLFCAASYSLPEKIRNRYFTEYIGKNIKYLFRINCPYLIYILYRVEFFYTNLKQQYRYLVDP